jgi:hypothetical protein
MTIHLDKTKLRAPGARGRGADATPPPANAVLSRRSPDRRCSRRRGRISTMCSCPRARRRRSSRTRRWPRRITVLGGEGTISLAGTNAGTAGVRAGDAIPVRGRGNDTVHQHRCRPARTDGHGRGERTWPRRRRC